MGRRLRIPRVLGISWWALLVVSSFEMWLRHVYQVPGWLPSIGGLWVIAQAVWLKLAEPSSLAVFLYLGSDLCDVLCDRLAHVQGGHRWTIEALSVFAGILWLAGIFIFRSDMERHFNETEPRGIVLGFVMTFFFNTLYFQYWLRQLYVEQNEPDLRLTPGPV